MSRGHPQRSGVLVRSTKSHRKRVNYEKTCAVLIVIVLLVVGLAYRVIRLVATSPYRGSDAVNINLATDPGKINEDAQAVKDSATELTGGVTEGVKADGQANDNVKSNGA